MKTQTNNFKQENSVSHVTCDTDKSCRLQGNTLRFPLNIKIKKERMDECEITPYQQHQLVFMVERER